jgi:hypothetical protein
MSLLQAKYDYVYTGRTVTGKTFLSFVSVDVRAHAPPCEPNSQIITRP